MASKFHRNWSNFIFCCVHQDLFLAFISVAELSNLLLFVAKGSTISIEELGLLRCRFVTGCTRGRFILKEVICCLFLAPETLCLLILNLYYTEENTVTKQNNEHEDGNYVGMLLVRFNTDGTLFLLIKVCFIKADYI